MDIVLWIGRIILGLLLIMSGVNHFKMRDKMLGMVKTKNIPMPMVAIMGTGLMLLVAGLSIISGMYLMIGYIILAVFLFFVSIKMHNFWSMSGPDKMANMHYFMGNFMLLGATLILLSAHI